MYILKVRYHENVLINDLDIEILYDDANGVLVEKQLFDKSKDAQLVKDKLIILGDENDFSVTPDKNVVELDSDLIRIQAPYENMNVFIRNYMETGNPAYAMYIGGEWKLFAVNGEGGSYTHPLTHPATMIVEDSNHKFVSDTQIADWTGKSNFSGNYNDLINKPSTPTLPTLANIATTGNYDDLVNKPVIPVLPILSTVAETGSYNDLTDKPIIPTLPTLSTVATSGNYNDLANKPIIPTLPTLSAVATSGDYNDIQNKPLFSTVAFSGNYNDLINIPAGQTDPSTLSAVATSGSYNDLTDKPNIPDITNISYNDLVNKPVIPVLPTLATVAETGSYIDLDDKPEIYSKSEVDVLISNTASAASGITLYEATGSTNKDCMILATGSGVQFSKSGNSAVLTIPVGVQVLSAQIHFSSSEIGTGANCLIDYGMGTNYTDMNIPTFQVVNDVANSRGYKLAPFPAANLNTSAHTLQLTGLTTSIAIWVKLIF